MSHDPQIGKCHVNWIDRKVFPQTGHEATGEKPHSDQSDVIPGCYSIKNWSKYQEPGRSEEEKILEMNQSVPAKVMVDEVFQEFSQTSSREATKGVIEYYARGGPQEATKRTPYYGENVYSARRLPPDQVPMDKPPEWISDLRPKWAERDEMRRSGGKERTFQEALEKVKNVFVSRGAVSTGRAMWRVISKFDADRSGAIDMFEFQKGMLEFGLQLTKEEVYMIMDTFDMDGNRRLNLAEFMTAIRGNLNPRRMRVVESAFDEMDSDKSGNITMHEISAAYDAKTNPKVMEGKMTREDAQKEFLEAIDPDGNKDVSKAEFLNFFKDISLMFPDDDDDGFFKFVRAMWRRKR